MFREQSNHIDKQTKSSTLQYTKCVNTQNMLCKTCFLERIYCWRKEKRHLILIYQKNSLVQNLIRYTKTKLNLLMKAFSISETIQDLTRNPRDKRGTNNNMTRDKFCPLHFSMVVRKWFYSFFSFGMQDYGFQCF